ncbi:MAG: CHC2 zinc finger domain-containing protein [Oscillospiraceae bacterium]|jgi:hypothetical protein
MIDFKSIKTSLDLIDTARYYGVHIVANSMINCLFHDDKNPSMKLYHDHFYCFGCGEHGDVIAFTAKLFGLSQYEAAQKLQSDFGISSEIKPSIRQAIKQLSQQEKEINAYRILNDYCKFLMKCRADYAPKTPDEPHHPLFIESLKKLDEYEYYCDIFITGTPAERKDFLETRKELLNDLNRKLHPVITHRNSEEIA